MNAIKKIFISLVLLIGADLVSAKDMLWPEELFPEDSHIKVIAENMKFNGVPMKIWDFTAIMQYNDVKEFYRLNWSSPAEGLKLGSPGFQIVETKNGCMISRMDGEFMITVQLNKVEHSQSVKGYFSISWLLNSSVSKFELGRNFPAMIGTVFVNDIEAIDGQKKSRTIVATSDAPYISVVNFYRSHMKQKGWTEQTGSLKPDFRGIALMFVNSNKEMNIAIAPKNGKVNIVAVETKE